MLLHLLHAMPVRSSLRFAPCCAIFLLSLALVPAETRAQTRAGAPAPARAQTQAEAQTEARQVVDRLSQKILATASDFVSSGKDPELFFLEVERLLDEVVDFQIFARGVMGAYVAEARMAALPPAERRKREQQITAFAEVFRHGLVQAYGNAFFSLSGKIQAKTVRSKKKSDTVEDVEQKITGIAERPVTVRYRMMHTGNSWRLHNIAIEKLNLGKLYRSQFHALTEKYEGDLDRVIASWISTPEKDEPQGRQDAQERAERAEKPEAGKEAKTNRGAGSSSAEKKS